MLIDRPQIVEGSAIQNATVASGTTPPALPNIGELFYNTTLGQIQAYNGASWAAITNAADFATHLADAALHLTPAQNTLLDGLVATLTSAELNFVDGVTSPIQTQLNTIVGVNDTQNTTLTSLQSQITANASSGTTALNTHIADVSLHLTAAQNTFLDAINLPTITGATVNSIPTLTSNLSALTTSFNTHVADLSLHLTTQQNAFLDGVNYATVGFSDINHLNGLDGFLGAGVALATYLSTTNSTLTSGKLNRDGTQSMTGALGMGGFRITALGAPMNATDAATKDYVDQLQQGLAWKDTAQVATTSNITLSGTQTIDGVALAVNARVLVKNQTNQAENGVYLVASGAWSRAPDANTAAELDGMAIFIRQGTVHQDTAWVQTRTLATFPGDAVIFSQFAAAGGATAGQGILIAGSTISARVGNGLTFSGQDIVLNVSGSFALGSQLDLSNTGVGAGTYRSVTVNTQGRVTSGTNPTTLAGYGITDAVLKSGDTMTGALSFSGGTSIAASAPGALNAWFSTAAYAVGQGDNRTHFGYNTGSSIVNFIRGAQTTISSPLTVNSAAIFDQPIRVGNPGAGYTAINLGNGTNPGFMEFFTQDSVRRGYVGWNDGSSRLLLAAETGWSWVFNVNPTVNGNPILNSSNYNSYSPTLTGGGASGTWNINVTGSAGSAGSVAWANVSGKPTQGDWSTVGSINNVVGLLSWKNYGNSHVIFDASNSTSPSGTAVSNSVPSVAWASTYPTLMGWNGAQTYGVKVNRADLADNSSLLAGVGPSVGTVASSIVQRDGSGYINNTYFNSSDNSVSSGVTAVMVKQGDNYLRSGTAAAIAGFISGQTFNTGGNAATSTLAAKASTLAQNGDNGAAMTFNWSGQGGQPAWLWGSNDGISHFVYNPSNFSVNYATTAGTASSATTATSAGTITGITSASIFRYETFTADANTLAANRSAFTHSLNAPYTGPMQHFEAGGYGLQFNAQYNNNGLNMAYRTRNGDTSSWNSWHTLLNSSNYNSYAPQLNGTGASGTWGINISGNSATTSQTTFSTLVGLSTANTSVGTASSGLQPTSSPGSTGATISFHRPGFYGLNMGLDSDNVFRIGGWSAAANRLQLDMSGNLSVAGALNAGGGATIAGTLTAGAIYASSGEVYSPAGMRIQNESPTFTFQDTDNMTASIHVNSNLFYVLRNPTANTTGWDSGPNGRHPMTLNLANGDVTFSGNVIAYSDRRLKRDIEPIYNALDKVSRLQGVSFKRIDTEDFEIGVIAQDVQQVVPEVVKEDQDGYLAVAYGNMTALLIEAVKELKAEVATLKAEIAALKA